MIIGDELPLISHQKYKLPIPQRSAISQIATAVWAVVGGKYGISDGKKERASLIIGVR